MEVFVLGIFEKGVEGLARGPLDQDHHPPRTDAGLRLHRAIQFAECHDLTTVLAHRSDRTARILAVEVVIRQVEEVQGVEGHSTAVPSSPSLLWRSHSGGSGQ